MHLKLPVL